MRELFMYFCIFRLIQQTHSIDVDRSVSALKDICDRFPWNSLCQAKDVVPITNPPVDMYLPDNQNLQPQHLTQNFCEKYSANFNNYCDGRSTDGVIVDFCHTYLQKCFQYEEADSTSTTTTTVATTSSSDHATPSFEQIKHYCDLYKKHYSILCVNSQIKDNAVKFCKAYHNVCPGAPDPGPSYPTDDGNVGQSQTKTLESSDSDQSRDGSSHDKQAQPGFLSGNIGGLLGIPSGGGGGPLSGIGDLANSMNVPHYGGPVQGGFSFGKTVFAPYFTGNKGFNIIPTKSYTQGQNYNFAGMSAGTSTGVDWSGTPGLGGLNKGLGLADNAPNVPGGNLLPGFGRKRRK